MRVSVSNNVCMYACMYVCVYVWLACRVSKCSLDGLPCCSFRQLIGVVSLGLSYGCDDRNVQHDCLKESVKYDDND